MRRSRFISQQNTGPGVGQTCASKNHYCVMTVHEFCDTRNQHADASYIACAGTSLHQAKASMPMCRVDYTRM